VDRLEETLHILADARERSPIGVVAFSGGKDSWVVLDLALRTFQSVEAVALTFMPEPLEQEEVQFAKAEALGVRVHRTMGPACFSALADSLYCDPTRLLDDVATPSGMDLCWYTAKQIGAPFVLTGNRKSEGADRRSLLNQQRHTHTIHPIRGWRYLDVVGYLGMRRIEIPPSEAKDKGGPRIDKRWLLWCHDHYPRDFERVRTLFPYIDALIAHRSIYGEVKAHSN
jgi:3'-phosphoadenosine 5'-phosphosulfate sulfotransferase (PAPS reductase)/FAD synthetase